MNRQTCDGMQMHTAGTFSEWKTRPMNFAQGAWRIDRLFLRSGSYQLKFADTHNFTGEDWGASQGVTGITKKTTGGDSNIEFYISKSGLYEIQFNDEALTYSISPSATKTLMKNMYVAGTFSGWRSYPMRFDSDAWSVNNLRLSAGTFEMKFFDTADFTGEDWGDHQGLQGIAGKTTGGKPNISFEIQTQGTYAIYFNDISQEYRVVNDTVKR
jgi:membrane protease subunit (stomatin/prohibitin family)